jgi:NIPSNAP
MIYEEREYTLKTGQVGPYLKFYEEQAMPVQGEIQGGLVGFFHTETGKLNKVVHIWAYDDFNERLRRRAEVWQHPDWPKFISNVRHMIVGQKNRILLPANFSPLK